VEQSAMPVDNFSLGMLSDPNPILPRPRDLQRNAEEYALASSLLYCEWLGLGRYRQVCHGFLLYLYRVL
jgi:hypothetical protein